MIYGVIVEPFAERHYIKSFAKKYKYAWVLTREMLQEELAGIDQLFQKQIAEMICARGDMRICKVEFKVVGTHESRHTSGNRSIVAVCAESKEVRVLLVYCKTDVRGSRETGWWQSMIRENYPEYKGLL